MYAAAEGSSVMGGVPGVRNACCGRQPFLPCSVVHPFFSCPSPFFSRSISFPLRSGCLSLSFLLLLLRHHLLCSAASRRSCFGVVPYSCCSVFYNNWSEGRSLSDHRAALPPAAVACAFAPSSSSSVSSSSSSNRGSSSNSNHSPTRDSHLHTGVVLVVSSSSSIRQSSQRWKKRRHSFLSHSSSCFVVVSTRASSCSLLRSRRSPQKPSQLAENPKDSSSELHPLALKRGRKYYCYNSTSRRRSSRNGRERDSSSTDSSSTDSRDSSATNRDSRRCNSSIGNRKSREVLGGSAVVETTTAKVNKMGERSAAEQQLSRCGVPVNWEKKYRFIDIGVNLTDEMFQGIYHGRQKHASDLQSVLARARAAGCVRLLITGGSLEDSAKAIDLCRSLDPEGQFLFATVGVHPTRCDAFLLESLVEQQQSQQQEAEQGTFHQQDDLRKEDGQDERVQQCDCQQNDLATREHAGVVKTQTKETEKLCKCDDDDDGDTDETDISEKEAERHLKDLCERLNLHPCAKSLQHLQQLYLLTARNRDRVAAIGEIGLDNDRLHFCSLETQKSCCGAVYWDGRRFFELQLLLSSCFSLPLFLHMRAADEDFCEILNRNKSLWESHGGVVHSFTGDESALKRILSVSPALGIGINGCSLKTAENLDVVRHIPLDRLHLETDAPWCEIRATHAAYAVLEQSQPEILAWSKNKAEKWSADAQVKGRNEPCNVVQVAVAANKLTAPERPFEEFCSMRRAIYRDK